MADYTINYDQLDYHPKLQECTTSIEKLRQRLWNYGDQEKASSGEIAWQAQTNQFITTCEVNLESYANACKNAFTEDYTEEEAQGVYDTKQECIAEREAILNDPDIKDPENTQQYKQLTVKYFDADKKLTLLEAEGFVPVVPMP